MAKTETFKTPVGRACFAHVFEPTQNDAGEERYSMMLVFPEDTDLEPMKRKIRKAIKEQFVGKKVPANFRSDPFRDNSEKEHLGEPFTSPGTFISAVSKYQPGVVDRNLNELLDRSDFDSGDYARMSINLFFYNTKGNQGISFGLQNIQKAKDGKRLSGGRPARDDFDKMDDDDFPDDDEDGEDDDLLE